MIPKLELEIGELSLDGFWQIDQKSLGSAIEAELTKLLKEDGLPSGLLAQITATQLDFGTMALKTNSGARYIGRQIAKNIYSGFKQNTTSLPHTSEALTKVAATPENQIHNTIV